MSTAPTGTVTFLFTDIEGSTRRWEQDAPSMDLALAAHDALLRRAIESRGGHIFKTVGDAFCAAFATPHDALWAALDAQFLLLAEHWQVGAGPLPVRMALHTGVAEERDGDYFGQPVNRVARLLSAGHGGQVLLSNATYDLVRDKLLGAVHATGAGEEATRIDVLDLGEHRLKDLIRPEHIFQLVVPGLQSDFPPLRTLDNRPNNLPRQATALIGREKETQAVCALLRRPGTALVTLTGPGGTGKTRLGLQAAAEMSDDFADGVWMVELAPVVDPSLVMQTIADTVGVLEAAGQSLLDRVKGQLRDRQILLLLDNFEQVSEAAPELGKLLAGCPNLKVLVTSRAPLRIRGEKEFPVPSLSLPAVTGSLRADQLSQYEAVRLFVERATDVQPTFVLDADNAPAVARICVQLDGLPLAIELAAARVRLFSPQALLSRLNSRLKLLTGGARDLPARQQTLRNTIAWSYDLLSEGEKQLFRRLSVFHGSRSLAAIESVTNWDGSLDLDVLEGIEGLLSKSLLTSRQNSGLVSDASAEPQFWMLETIQEYAREKLEESGEAGPLRRRHALYFTAIAEETEARWRSGQQSSLLARLDADLDNMRGALSWARESKDEDAAEIGLELAGGMFRFWYVRGHFTEAREQFSALLSLGTQGPDGWYRNQAPPTRARAMVLLRLGSVAWAQGDYQFARTALEASLAMYRAVGDRWGEATALLNTGNLDLYVGDYPSARSLYEESLRIHKDAGDKHGIISALTNVGLVAQYEKDYEAARQVMEEALMLALKLGDKHGTARILNSLADISWNLGDFPAAATRSRESLAMRREVGYTWGAVESIESLARIAGSEGNVVRAARLWAAARAMRAAIGAPVPPSEQEEYDRQVRMASERLADDEWRRASAEGEAMPMDKAIDYALGSE